MDHVWRRTLVCRCHLILICALLPALPRYGTLGSQPWRGSRCLHRGCREVPPSVAPDPAPDAAPAVQLPAIPSPGRGCTEGCLHHPVLGQNLCAEQYQEPTHPGQKSAGTALWPSLLWAQPGEGSNMAVRKGKGCGSFGFGLGETFATTR